MAEAWKLAVSPKQLKLVQLCHVKPGKPKYVLVSGPRFSTKSMACFNAIVDHLWSVKNASGTMVSPTVSSGADQGSWTMLTTVVIPQWISGNFGLKWITEPTQDGVTKKMYFEIRNKHGGVSRMQLDSLQYEKDAEAAFKNKNYSLMYVPELSYFKQRATFDVLGECLRGPQWQEEDFLFLGDTNPAEEGEESWIYKFWYDFLDDGDVDEDAKVMQSLMARMEFTVADNIFVSPKRIAEQLAKYAHSEDLMARYRDGKWVKAVGNSIFFEVFRPKVHIQGEHETPKNPDPEILLPEENCTSLLTGWDIGQGANSGFCICEKLFRLAERKPTKDNPATTFEQSYFKFLDEVVHIKSEATMGDFVEECLEKVQYWEDFLGRAIQWRNWSDRSAFDRREPIANLYHHQLVYQITGGKIILQAADRSPGSVRQRVDITKKLCFEDRIYLSRSRVPNLIDSFQGLRAGKGSIAIQKDSPLKHAYDAGSYILVSECYDELMFPKKDKGVRVGSSLVQIPL